MFQFVRSSMLIGLALTVPAFLARAARPTAERDAIRVIGNLEIRNCNIHHIHMTEHEWTDLLYLEDTYKNTAMVVDVTDAAHPKIVREVATPKGFSNVEALAGDSALVADQSSLPETEFKSMSIVTLDDKADGPRIEQTFANVTALSEDNRRGLIYLIDQNGLEVLQKSFSPDPAVVREFEKRMLYDR
jgi:hypothetical protein